MVERARQHGAGFIAFSLMELLTAGILGCLIYALFEGWGH
jgi:hypothetical protein